MPTVVENQILTMLGILLEGQRKLEAGVESLRAGAGSRGSALAQRPLPERHSAALERLRASAGVQPPSQVERLSALRASRLSVPKTVSEELPADDGFFSSAPKSDADSAPEEHDDEPLAASDNSQWNRFADRTSCRSSIISTGVDSYQEATGWVLPVTWPKCIPTRDFIGSSGGGAGGDIIRRLGSRYGKIVNTKTSSRDDLIPEELVIRGKSKMMLDPHGKIRVMFDQVSCVALLYDMIALPIMMAWNISVTGAFYVLALITAIFWSIDLVLNFRTSYYMHGILVTDPKLVAKRYLRTWFTLDVVILFTNLLGIVVNDSEVDDSTSLQFLRFFKATRILRIIGVMRVLRISEILKRYADRTLGTQFQPLVDIPGLVFFLVFANHLIGCCWFAVGIYAPSDTGLRWVNTRLDSSQEGALTIIDTSVSFQYFTALHWSLTQMTPGSMSVQPENSAERILNIVCLVIGMILFSSIISRLSAKLVQYTTMNQERSRMMEKLGTALRRMQISPQLTASAGLLARDRLSTRDTTTTYDEVLSILPEKMHLVIYYEMCRQHLKHPLFRWWMITEESAVRMAFRKSVSFVNLNKEDTLFLATAPATCVYVAVRGALRYSQDPENSKVMSCKLKTVELNTLIAEPALWCLWTHVGTTEATLHSEVLVINAVQLLHAVQQSPATLEVFRAYGKEFHQRLIASRPPLASYPSDLSVPHASFGECLSFLSSNVRVISSMACVSQLRETLPSAGAFSFLPRSTTALSTGTDVPHKTEDEKAVADVADKVYSGHHAVCFDTDGNFEVVSTVVYARLGRPDGRIFVVLGPVSRDGYLTLKAELPQRPLASSLGLAGTVRHLAEQWLGRGAAEMQLEEHVRRSKLTKKHPLYTLVSHHLGLDAMLTRSTRDSVSNTCLSTLVPSGVSRSKLGSMLKHTMLLAVSAECSRMQELLDDDDEDESEEQEEQEEQEGPEDGDETGAEKGTIPSQEERNLRFWWCAWMTTEEFENLVRDGVGDRLALAVNTVQVPQELRKQAVMNHYNCREESWHI